MKRIADLSFEDRKEFAELLDCWLSQYVDEIFVALRPRFEEILNNEVYMMMLRRLKEERDKAKSDRIRHVDNVLYYGFSDLKDDCYSLWEGGPHKSVSCLNKASDYCGVLHDVFIKPIHVSH